MTPDCKGTYEDAGEAGSKRYYGRVPNGFYIWWNGSDTWHITTTLGPPIGSWWTRIDPDIEGLYTHQGTAEGDATVTEI